MLKIICVCIFTIIAMFYAIIKLSDCTHVQRAFGAVVIGIIVFALSFWIIPDSKKDEGGQDYARCSSCNLSYSEGSDYENYNNIIYTRMCKRCYNKHKSND